MTFSEFAQILHDFIGVDGKQWEFPGYLLSLFMHEPCTDEDKQLDAQDKYYPYGTLKQKSAAEKVYAGDDNRNLPVKVAGFVLGHQRKTALIDAIDDLDDDPKDQLCRKLTNLGIACDHCEAYADALERPTVCPDDIPTLPKKFGVSFSSQRKAYYAAESVRRSVRDAIDDGDHQFELLEDEAYAGIEETYWSDYKNGHKRLNAVFGQITSVAWNKSALFYITNLIGALEKKGICHILVNNEKIGSWVHTDEEVYEAHNGERRAGQARPISTRRAAGSGQGAGGEMSEADLAPEANSAVNDNVLSAVAGGGKFKDGAGAAYVK